MQSKPANYSVIYHNDKQDLWNAPDGAYKTLIEFYKEQLHKHDIKLIHLSTEGHDGWGDVNIHYPGNPEEVMWNRENFFVKFLKEDAEDEYYWFGEPDVIIDKLPLPTDCDLCVLARPDDGVKINPTFRLAKKSALPYFEELVENYNMDKKKWHGDSDAHAYIGNKLESMRKFSIGKHEYNGMKIELREHDKYLHQQKSEFLRHFKFTNKKSLLEMIERQNEDRRA